jgi:hypothetical protein
MGLNVRQGPNQVLRRISRGGTSFEVGFNLSYYQSLRCSTILLIEEFSLFYRSNRKVAYVSAFEGGG